MSDTRFASLKTDPRFRRLKKHHSKVVLDDRFKDLLGDRKKGKKSTRAKQTKARVDKYGRTVSDTQEKDDLGRFYRLEAEDGGEEDAAMAPTTVDYARGAVLMESSDEDGADGDSLAHVPSVDGSGSDSDEGGFVSLGVDPKKLEEDEAKEAEIDLDENTIVALDAQVAEYAEAVPQREETSDIKQTKRLAVVNLDWDYVRAVHLYKIFSSLVSPIPPVVSASTSHTEETTTLTGRGRVNVARGEIISVRVYPSEFGKKRMAREEREGPPAELFKKNKKVEEINEKTIFETGDEADYDEDALRKYQLERLRYYYAIAECDTVEAAVHVYNELEGAELERSANVFDLSFVPDDMTFDDEPRDEATQLPNVPYRAVEFVTDALRHSKVKLTWDEDDPERNYTLRRPLTKKELEEADFRAYIASSSSSDASSGDEGADGTVSKETGGRKTEDDVKNSIKAERDKLRKLFFGGNDDELPERWGNPFDNKTSKGGRRKTRGGEESDVDMEVTFMPGFSEMKNPEDENTLERYQRKSKEKRKKKKEEAKKRGEADGDEMSARKTVKSSFDDEFFGVENDSQYEEASPNRSGNMSTPQPTETSAAELALLAASDNPHGEPAHFDMKAVLKAEKLAKNKKFRHKSKKWDKNDVDDGPEETQDNFIIDVRDDRFAAIHEDHRFAIDPTHPQFKKTKSMTALLGERSKRQKSKSRSDHPVQSQSAPQRHDRSLQSLVESVKRKGAVNVDHGGLGKRRYLGKS